MFACAAEWTMHWNKISADEEQRCNLVKILKAMIDQIKCGWCDFIQSSDTYDEDEHLHIFRAPSTEMATKPNIEVLLK